MYKNKISLKSEPKVACQSFMQVFTVACVNYLQFEFNLSAKITAIYMRNKALFSFVNPCPRPNGTGPYQHFLVF